MWKEEIHKFLEINQLAFEITQNQSAFCLLFIKEHQLYLHLIDLQTFQYGSLPNNYFQTLSDSYNAQNQRIIHLWEDVYISKTELVKSRILTMLGFFKTLNARHCHIERIDMPMAERFLNKHHLQGFVKAKFKYGLFLRPQYVEKYLGFSIYDKVESLDNVDLRVSFREPSIHNPINLIAVATFSGGRLMKIGERAGTRSFELTRFATMQGYVVVGGMDKLLTAFTKEHQPDDIMSYADRDWSDGRSYDKLGFTKIDNTLPQHFFINLENYERIPINGLASEENIEICNTGSIKYIKYIQSFI